MFSNVAKKSKENNRLVIRYEDVDISAKVAVAPQLSLCINYLMVFI